MANSSRTRESVALSLVAAISMLAGCGGSGASGKGAGQAGDSGSTEQDGGDASDAGGAGGGLDAGETADAGADAQIQVGADAGIDAGCQDPSCMPAIVPPFQLDCSTLPANRACQGGPHEVLLAIDETGVVAMFEPSDGHFLGYFKRAADTYNVDGTEGYTFATQGPDQCIWTLSNDDAAGVQRWKPDGTLLAEKALEDHTFPVSGGGSDPAVQSPTALAFSEDRVYVASEYGEPKPRLTRWMLDGKFDELVLEGGDVTSTLVLGDGSLLIADADPDAKRVAKVTADGQQTPVLGGLFSPGQIAYAGDGKVLVIDTEAGEPVRMVDILSGRAQEVKPALGTGTSLNGVAPLANGKWLVAGGDVGVSTLDPATGKVTPVFKDLATEAVNFQYVGRACLSEEFLASRVAAPANDTCIDPPAGATIYSEDFEGTGDFVGTGASLQYNLLYSRGAKGFAVSIGTGPAGGTRALQLIGAGTLQEGQQYLKTGLYARFPASNPSYIRYRVYVPAKTAQYLGVLVFENEAIDTSETARLIGTYVYDGYVEAEESNAATPSATYVGKWVTVEMRNIDWSARTYDLYVDCTRVTAGIGLPAGLGDSMDLLDLYNIGGSVDATTVSWIDDILVK